MDALAIANNGNHANGPVNGIANGGAEGAANEFKDAVAGIGLMLNENLAAISTHVNNAESAQREILKHLDQLFESWAQHLQAQYHGTQQHLEEIARRYDGVQQQIKGVQHHHDTVLQEFNGFKEQFQAAQQQCQEARQECQSFAQQFGAAEQKVKGLEQRLEAALAECSTISSAMQEEARRRENVEVAIGAFGQDIGALRTTEIARLKDDIDTLRAASVSGRRRQRFAILVAFLALLAAGYVGFGKPGWTALASLVAPLLPAGPI